MPNGISLVSLTLIGIQQISQHDIQQRSLSIHILPNDRQPVSIHQFTPPALLQMIPRGTRLRHEGLEPIEPRQEGVQPTPTPHPVRILRCVLHVRRRDGQGLGGEFERLAVLLLAEEDADGEGEEVGFYLASCRIEVCGFLLFHFHVDVGILGLRVHFIRQRGRRRRRGRELHEKIASRGIDREGIEHGLGHEGHIGEGCPGCRARARPQPSFDDLGGVGVDESRGCLDDGVGVRVFVQGFDGLVGEETFEARCGLGQLFLW